MWHAFSLCCGTYSLHDIKDAKNEAEKIKILKLAVIPKRQYDPKNMAYNFTTHVKIAKFEHDKDDYDELLTPAESFS